MSVQIAEKLDKIPILCLRLYQSWPMVASFLTQDLNVTNLLSRRPIPKHLYHEIHICLWLLNFWKLYVNLLFSKFPNPCSFLSNSVLCIQKEGKKKGKKKKENEREKNGNQQCQTETTIHISDLTFLNKIYPTYRPHMDYFRSHCGVCTSVHRQRTHWDMGHTGSLPRCRSKSRLQQVDQWCSRMVRF